MALSFTRPDPSSPSSVASAAFTSARKGFEQAEVREFLRMVAAELARLQERERFLERELRASQRSTSPSSIALDEEMVTRMLGEEAARIIHTARDAASQIKIRAEDGAARLLREATDEAQRLREEAEIESSRRRSDATADAEAELEMAKQQGREMVNEARAYRERVLGELARRRELARQQIEQLVHGRDRLLQAFERSRLVAMDVMAELTPLGEPDEYVDLSPTTGPVPLMVKNSPRPGSVEAAAAAALAAGPPPESLTVGADDLTVAHPAPILDVDLDDLPEPIAVDEPASPEPVTPDAEVSAPTDDGVVDDGVVDDGVVDDGVVHLDIRLSDDRDIDAAADDDRASAPVVALFGDETETTETETEPTETTEGAAGDGAESAVSLRKPSADDLFARLRAARAETVVRRAGEMIDTADAGTPAETESVTADDDGAGLSAPDAPTASVGEDSVFNVTPAAPAAPAVVADSPFARRDEALTPLIVASARKLKRVLADEQNEVLHVLRAKEPITSVEQLLASEAEQSARYNAGITAELTAAAVAGATSMGATVKAAQRDVKKSNANAAAAEVLTAEIVQPLRVRLARCVSDAGGDNAELASLVRLVYREWKTQRIDEHLDDIARTAFGRGALAGVAPGTPICWTIDPAGPECPDAEDNSLAGAVAAGEPFPTDHPCAPAHSGCRCMIVPVL
jgi:DivIVA domain-containing protein